jgi:hypothetical protein
MQPTNATPATPHTIITPAFDFSKVPDDALIDLAGAAKLIPGRVPGKRTCLGVLQRWSNPQEGRSCGTFNGPRVYVVLPTILRGFKRWTHPAAVEMWKAKCHQIDNPPQPPRGRTDRQATAAHNRAVARLKKMGLMRDDWTGGTAGGASGGDAA